MFRTSPNIIQFESRETAFNHIANTMLKQGETCRDSRSCLLSDPSQQTVCAIGATLTEQGRHFYRYGGKLLDQDKEVVLQWFNVDEFSDIQHVHDLICVSEWRTKFTELAQQFHITPSFIPESEGE